LLVVWIVRAAGTTTGAGASFGSETVCHHRVMAKWKLPGRGEVFTVVGRKCSKFFALTQVFAFVVLLLPVSAFAQSEIARDPALQSALKPLSNCLDERVGEGKARQMADAEFQKFIFAACAHEASEYGGVLRKFMQVNRPKMATDELEKVVAVGVQMARVAAYYKFTGAIEAMKSRRPPIRQPSSTLPR